MAYECALAHPPKQLEMIELKLEMDSEKERKTKPRHETHIMGPLAQTSKYTSKSLWGRASHMGNLNGIEVDEGKQREKPIDFGRAHSLNQGF